MSKKRDRSRVRGYSHRIVGTRELIQRFLIVCEGEKTEPNYFHSFRVPKNVIDIRGLGDNTIRLVQAAIKIREEGNYDQTWCVFDRDSFPANDFNAALILAEKKGIRVAYSNEAFELWYLLHFHYYQTGISRHDYSHMLTKLLKREYRKNSESIYSDLEHLQDNAIKNAKRLLEQYNPPRPESDNPSTTVHLLVEELNKFSR